MSWISDLPTWTRVKRVRWSQCLTDIPGSVHPCTKCDFQRLLLRSANSEYIFAQRAVRNVIRLTCDILQALFKLSLEFRREETRFLNKVEEQKGMEKGSSIGLIEDDDGTR